ncbi:hypothetical protein AB1Y20_014592 [Prymnesium parvum]|uniref:SAP domain-containing protein n=1 Tax=Prymnesium parvum TaxID=97485 RepID=A0AB34IEL4_PRYPA
MEPIRLRVRTTTSVPQFEVAALPDVDFLDVLTAIAQHLQLPLSDLRVSRTGRWLEAGCTPRVYGLTTGAELVVHVRANHYREEAHTRRLRSKEARSAKSTKRAVYVGSSPAFTLKALPHDDVFKLVQVAAHRVGLPPQDVRLCTSIGGRAVEPGHSVVWYGLKDGQRLFLHTRAYKTLALGSPTIARPPSGRSGAPQPLERHGAPRPSSSIPAAVQAGDAEAEARALRVQALEWTYGSGILVLCDGAPLRRRICGSDAALSQQSSSASTRSARGARTRPETSHPGKRDDWLKDRQPHLGAPPLPLPPRRMPSLPGTTPPHTDRPLLARGEAGDRRRWGPDNACLANDTSSAAALEAAAMCMHEMRTSIVELQHVNERLHRQLASRSAPIHSHHRAALAHATDDDQESSVSSSTSEHSLSLNVDGRGPDYAAQLHRAHFHARQPRRACPAMWQYSTPSDGGSETGTERSEEEYSSTERSEEGYSSSSDVESHADDFRPLKPNASLRGWNQESPQELMGRIRNNAIPGYGEVYRSDAGVRTHAYTSDSESGYQADDRSGLSSEEQTSSGGNEESVYWRNHPDGRVQVVCGNRTWYIDAPDPVRNIRKEPAQRKSPLRSRRRAQSSYRHAPHRGFGHVQEEDALQFVCNELGLSSLGTKRQLIQRIQSHMASTKHHDLVAKRTTKLGSRRAKTIS